MYCEIAVVVDGALEKAAAAYLEEAQALAVTVQNAGEGLVFPGQAFERCRVSGLFESSVDTEEIKMRLSMALSEAGADPMPPVEIKPIQDQDWQEAWKAHHKPLKIGRRFLVLPSWSPVPQNSVREILRLDPGMAFGAGSHATTRGCLEALEREADQRPLTRVLDLGAGSGILSLGALKLGAEQVLATEIDADALRACTENLQGNGFMTEGEAASRFELRAAGDIPEGRFQVVMANILASVLHLLMKPHAVHGRTLSGAVAPGGLLILSGLLREQAGEMAATCKQKGLIDLHTLYIDEWAVITARQPDHHP